MARRTKCMRTAAAAEPAAAVPELAPPIVEEDTDAVEETPCAGEEADVANDSDMASPSLEERFDAGVECSRCFFEQFTEGPSASPKCRVCGQLRQWMRVDSTSDKMRFLRRLDRVRYRVEDDDDNISGGEEGDDEESTSGEQSDPEPASSSMSSSRQRIVASAALRGQQLLRPRPIAAAAAAAVDLTSADSTASADAAPATMAAVTAGKASATHNVVPSLAAKRPPGAVRPLLAPFGLRTAKLLPPPPRPS